jgi:hypothetical protein
VLVSLISPSLIATIVSIPAVEFVNENSRSSFAQALETGKILVPEMIGNAAATMALPGHTGIFRIAADKDRQRLQTRMRMGAFLDQINQDIGAGKLDRVVWLEAVTQQLNKTEYPDRAMTEFAGKVVQGANDRKRRLSSTYRKDIDREPRLKAQYDQYDPGWSQW